MGFDNFKDHNMLLNINIDTEKKYIINFASALFKGRVSNIIAHDASYRPISANYNESVLLKMGIPSSTLIKIFLDTNEDSMIRAACICCYINQNSSRKSEFINDFFEKKYDEIFVSLLQAESQDLLINALYTFVYDIPTYDNRLMEFLGGVSIATKEDYNSRLILQNVYQRWRERSFAPVNRSQSLASWLDYTY
jgi:hypothetical protein